MISRYQVSLDNNDMAELDDNLLILNVSHDEPKKIIDTAQLGSGDGLYIAREHKERASVTVTFELHHYSIKKRQEACQKVVAWARKGGMLRVNDREGQFLRCICESFPYVNSVRDWTAPLSITFTAYGLPYWQEDEATILTLTGASASGTLKVPGNADDARVEVFIVPKNTLTNIKITVGSTSISLEGISVASNSSVDIYYDSDVLKILSGKKSLLANRTGASSDDLMAKCGGNTSVSVTANVSVTATIMARGCWQ